MRAAPANALATAGATSSLARTLGFALGPALVTATWTPDANPERSFAVLLGLALAAVALLALRLRRAGPAIPAAATSRLRVVALCGSLRRNSLNRKLLLAAADLAPANLELPIAGLGDLPLFNQDLEHAGDPTPVRRLKEIISAADAVLIATPEHNRMISAALANAIEWLSRPYGQSVLRGKPIAIMGATPGPGGTRLAQAVLRQALQHSDPILLGRSVALGRASSLFTHDGTLVDPAARTLVQDLLADLAAAVSAAGESHDNVLVAT
jgi:chromate reductase